MLVAIFIYYIDIYIYIIGKELMCIYISSLYIYISTSVKSTHRNFVYFINCAQQFRNSDPHQFIARETKMTNERSLWNKLYERCVNLWDKINLWETKLYCQLSLNRPFLFSYFPLLSLHSPAHPAWFSFCKLTGFQPFLTLWHWTTTTTTTKTN